MSQYNTELKQIGIPKLGIAILAIIFGVGLFVVGFDQGHIFSIVMGETAFDEMLIHELTHDLRHVESINPDQEYLKYIVLEIKYPQKYTLISIYPIQF